MRSFISLALTLVLALTLTGIASAEALADGVYTGSGAGRNGDVTVSVTVTDGKIADVEVTGHSETAGIADPAIEKLPQMIVAAQSTQIDGISGATLTSEAVKEAVNDAIRQAGVDPAALTAQTVSYEKNLAPGTYTGTGHGHHSDITVEVTVSETSIDAIEVTACGDNMHIADAAVERIPGAIVNNQSLAVDTVTGATYTSRAILSAVENALIEAGGDPLAFQTAVPRWSVEQSSLRRATTWSSSAPVWRASPLPLPLRKREPPSCCSKSWLITAASARRLPVRSNTRPRWMTTVSASITSI